MRKKIGVACLVISASLALAGLVLADVPGRAVEINKKGAELVNEEEWEGAERFFRKALKIDPGYAAARNNLGYCLRKRGEIEEAIREYEKALELSQNARVTRQARFNLVNIYVDKTIGPPVRKTDWPDKCIPHLEALLEDDPDSAPLHMWLGFTYFDAMNPGGGFIELDKASRLADTGEELWIHERLMEFYRAINMLEKLEEEESVIKKLQGA